MNNKEENSTHQPVILIVDDDEGIRSQLKWALAEEYRVLLAKDADESYQLIEREQPNIVALDISLSSNGSEEGLEVLQQIILMNSKIKVIMVTGNDKKDVALKSIQLGAYDYYQKPIDIDELKVIIKRALNIQQLELENETLFSELQQAKKFENIIGDSPKMLEVYDILRRVVSTSVPVLIYGESGTGKELVARAIHYRSPRKDKPFVPINCGAIPDNLLESELFGHEKGSFTGAYYQKKGKFENAHNGTAFLDEIGELTPSLQVKLLRFLQENEIERVGGKQPLHVDVRIVAATNRNLNEEIERGTFRVDLFYRLSVITINLPPLRERGDDILLLASSFLNKYAKEYGKRIHQFETLALEKMKHYRWPGNVRELENRVKRAVLMNLNGILSCKDLDLADDVPAEKVLLTEVVDDIQQKYIDTALYRNHGNISRAAKELGISRVTLYDLIKKFKIKVNDYRKRLIAES